MSIKLPNPATIPVVILAGGRGTRLMEETQLIPKPMVTIGGKPILLHIMRHYSAFGFKKFVICLGYKGHLIKEYFMHLPRHTSSVVVNTGTGEYAFQSDGASEWEVALVETGEHSLTGTRVAKVRSFIDAPHFCLTYGDGLSNIPIDQELEFHVRHGRLGTVAAVHPPSRFGMLDISEDGKVQSFKEKEVLPHDYINGGYFIFRREFLDRLGTVENESLESAPLRSLAEEGELHAFQHKGFWKCMDTLRDRETLEEIFDSGKAPWIPNSPR